MNDKRERWESYHYRFGLAGEGQADVIQAHLVGRSGRVVNVGCGPRGCHLDELAKYCKLLVATDISAQAVGMARRSAVRSNVVVIRADAHRLPFGDGCVDQVIALGLFASIPSPRTVLEELARVCRPAGVVMVTNAVIHRKERLAATALASGLDVVEDYEGHCYAASGEVKRRYMLVLRPIGRRPELT